MIDQIGRHIHLKSTPKRIISLVPSQTELLCDLGLEKSLVGVTKFCVHPEHIKKKIAIVGGTKDVKYELIKSLNPDIILCNKEENTKEIVETSQEIAPVHVSDIFSVEDAITLIHQYGKLFSVDTSAEKIALSIQQERERFQESIRSNSVKKVAYFIWRKPWMVAGGNTFINHLLELNRFENVFSNRQRYPEVKLSELKKITDLDYIFLSSEPFPFKEKHISEIKKELPEVKIVLVDGEYFSWYGSRLQAAFSYFEGLHGIL
ncbi:ABC transporter substrate-binding protein [Galbibacter mesophilus]|uniref:ABC transporter substrate-binding protein n=1 Tax=Galbibacter mesophilus TaxID=379069 RepID=UPI00191D33BD|nr:helical backbone metal receptor [Galbibacter mesophilus]MCM5664441.1 helical backbone metal receptor [Galbibacter mesophilus]